MASRAGAATAPGLSESRLGNPWPRRPCPHNRAHIEDGKKRQRLVAGLAQERRVQNEIESYKDMNASISDRRLDRGPEQIAGCSSRSAEIWRVARLMPLSLRIDCILSSQTGLSGYWRHNAQHQERRRDAKPQHDPPPGIWHVAEKRIHELEGRRRPGETPRSSHPAVIPRQARAGVPANVRARAACRLPTHPPCRCRRVRATQRASRTTKKNR